MFLIGRLEKPKVFQITTETQRALYAFQTLHFDLNSRLTDQVRIILQAVDDRSHDETSCECELLLLLQTPVINEVGEKVDPPLYGADQFRNFDGQVHLLIARKMPLGPHGGDHRVEEVQQTVHVEEDELTFWFGCQLTTEAETGYTVPAGVLCSSEGEKSFEKILFGHRFFKSKLKLFQFN